MLSTQACASFISLGSHLKLIIMLINAAISLTSIHYLGNTFFDAYDTVFKKPTNQTLVLVANVSDTINSRYTITL